MPRFGGTMFITPVGRSTDNTRWSEILVENSDFFIPHLQPTSHQNIAMTFAMEKPEWLWLSDGEIKKATMRLPRNSTSQLLHINITFRHDVISDVIFQVIQRQLPIATTWRHVLGSRRRGYSVYGWHVFLHQLTPALRSVCRPGPLARWSAGCYIRHGRRAGGRRVGSVGSGSVPGPDTCVSACVCRIRRSVRQLLWPTLSQSSTRRTCRWLTPPGRPGWLAGKVVAQQRHRHDERDAETDSHAGVSCEQGARYTLQFAQLTYRQLHVWRHYTKYLPLHCLLVSSRRWCCSFCLVFSFAHAADDDVEFLGNLIVRSVNQWDALYQIVKFRWLVVLGTATMDFKCVYLT